MISSQKLYDALAMSVRDMNSTYDENELVSHRFSWRYKRRKKAVIKAYQKSAASPREFDIIYRKISFCQRLRIAVIVAVTATLLTGAGVIMTYYIGGILAEQQSTHTYASAFNLEGTPGTLEKAYRLNYDLNEYEKDVICDDEYQYWEYYQLNDDYIDFSYYTKSIFQESRLNTEGTNIIKKTINGYEALYFIREDGTQCLVWDNGEYIFNVVFSIDYDKIVEILETIEEKE